MTFIIRIYTIDFVISKYCYFIPWIENNGSLCFSFQKLKGFATCNTQVNLNATNKLKSNCPFMMNEEDKYWHILINTHLELSWPSNGAWWNNQTKNIYRICISGWQITVLNTSWLRFLCFQKRWCSWNDAKGNFCKCGHESPWPVRKKISLTDIKFVGGSRSN